MASDFVLRISNLLPNKLTEHLKRRIPPKGASRHRIILDYISDTDTVLDIGCVRHSLDDIDWKNPDPGEWLHAEIRQKAKDTVGIDMAEAEVEELNKSGLNVHTANAETFVLDEYFDVIVAGELIEHLSNPGQFLQRCQEHLKKDGIVIISTPNPRRLQTLYWYSTGDEHQVNPEHTMWFDHYVMSELVSRYNFEFSEWKYYRPSISLVSRPLYDFGILRPITAGGFVFVLKQT